MTLRGGWRRQWRGRPPPDRPDRRWFNWGGPEIIWLLRNLPAKAASPSRKMLKYQRSEFGIEIAIDLAPGGFSHGDRGSGSVQRGDGAGQRPGTYAGAGRGPAVHGGPVRASDRAVAPGQPGGVRCGSSPARPFGRDRKSTRLNSSHV